MTIDFGNESAKTACQMEWNLLDPEERLTYSHFELAEETNIKDIDVWMDFLKDPRVMDKLNEELSVFKQAQQRKLIQRATSHDRSVGTAQMITALGKTIESQSNTGGQMFIYTYVPPNSNEVQAPNVATETKDIFER